MNDGEKEEIKRLPLRDMLITKYGMSFDRSSFAICPFHKGGKENNPSFRVTQNNIGFWRWYCFGCNEGGDYIDFRMKMDGTDFTETVKNIQSENSLKSEAKRRKNENSKRPIASFVYQDENGNQIYRKLKFENKEYTFERFENNEWKRGLNNTRRILYNLPGFINSNHVFLLEGEKDCETLKSFDFIATTPGSVNDWKEEFSKYFKDKEVFICLDVGNEKTAEKIANDLSKITKNIKILKLPGLTEREQDITNWFESMSQLSIEEKKVKLAEVISKTPQFKIKKVPHKHRAETIRELREREVSPREIFVKNWAEKEALTILGGEKKTGKSLLALNLGVNLALGNDFLGFKVPKPRKVLYIQQEIADWALRDRSDKLLQDNDSDLLDNFTIITTTGDLLKITSSKDREQILSHIEDIEPDLAIFDPFSTFHNKNENDASEMNEILDFFFEIIHKFHIGIFVIHHFGKPTLNKRDGGHLFRGHSVLADRPDINIVMRKISDKYKKMPLPYDYDCYSEIHFELRSDAKPGMLIVERNPDSLKYKTYDFYGFLGKKIPPIKVKEIIEDNGGEMLQPDLLSILCKMASYTVAWNAINEAKERGDIEIIPTQRRGNPNLLKTKKEEFIDAF